MKAPHKMKTGWGFESSFKAFRAAGPLFGSGIQLAAAAVLMFFLGQWLDGRLGTYPWLIIVCVLFGIGGGLYNFINTIKKIEEDEKKRSKDD